LFDYKDKIKQVVSGCRNIDLKQHYLDKMQDPVYTYALMMTIGKLYVKTYNVSQSLRIPDMDPSRLRIAIEGGLQRYKNERIIKQNHGAYRELIDSVIMLEENFDNYYNGYVKTGNVANIFEQYVIDVAEEKKDKKHMKAQFAKIITFFKMKAQPIIQKSQAPELRNLFNAADKKFSSFMTDAEKLEVNEDPDIVAAQEEISDTEKVPLPENIEEINIENTQQ
jgi:hypothetical protein